MPYELHIIRTEEPRSISVEEWWAVVDADPTMERVEVLEHKNPTTGELIRMELPGGACWRPAGAILTWSRGRITIAWRSHRPDVLAKLKSLAGELRAHVQGDEGERY